MMARVASSERSNEGMGGLAKGLAIIEALAAHGVLSVSDAARTTDISRAAARRCLITLTELGYVEQAGREFRPLPRLRRLGGATTRRDQMARLADPLLKHARDQLAESVSLAVLDDDKSLFIARAEAEHILSTGVRIGATLPVYCSATGRVLLSQLPDTEIGQRVGRKPLPARTPHTITKLAPLLIEIQAVRKRGYAISDEELELGMRALAVPVIGDGHEIVAAISVSAASARVRAADLRNQFLPVLQACARSLSEAMRSIHAPEHTKKAPDNAGA
jgi:IclR family transcriptional regulator, pca regulon regulatory protein